MSPRALLFTGVGTLAVGLFLLLSINTDPATASGRALLAQGYVSNVCVLVGSGLVLLAAVFSALRSRNPAVPAPNIDHYS